MYTSRYYGTFWPGLIKAFKNDGSGIREADQSFNSAAKLPLSGQFSHYFSESIYGEKIINIVNQARHRIEQLETSDSNGPTRDSEEVAEQLRHQCAAIMAKLKEEKMNQADFQKRHQVRKLTKF